MDRIQHCLIAAAASLFLSISSARAQQPPTQTAQEQVASTIGTLVMTNAALAEQTRQLQARIAQLEHELAEAKKAAEPSK